MKVIIEILFGERHSNHHFYHHFLCDVRIVVGDCGRGYRRMLLTKGTDFLSLTAFNILPFHFFHYLLLLSISLEILYRMEMIWKCRNRWRERKEKRTWKRKDRWKVKRLSTERSVPLMIMFSLLSYPHCYSNLSSTDLGLNLIIVFLFPFLLHSSLLLHLLSDLCFLMFQCFLDSSFLSFDNLDS